jgi:hypothetical protein
MAIQEMNLAWSLGEDATFTVTMNPVMGIAGWTLEFFMKTVATSPVVVLTKTIGNGITVLDSVNGIFTVQVLRADTEALGFGIYSFSVRRIDSGLNTELVRGAISVLPSAGG